MARNELVLLNLIKLFSFKLLRPALGLVLLILPYQAQAQFVTRGDAVKLSNKCYQVTPEALNRFGTIWWPQQIDLAQPFELNFIIYLGKRDQDGADGLAFVLQNDARGLQAAGSSGSGLGFGVDVIGGQTNAISPSVGIEFDTFSNGATIGDIDADHTTVIYNGQMGQPRFPPVSIDPNSSDVENQKCHEYKITWNPATQELKLFFDGVLRFSHQDDLIKNVFNGKSPVYYGFTGSTGGFINEQTVCLIDPNSQPVAQNDQADTTPYQAVTVPVLQNDAHTTGEALQLSAIARAPQHGTAVISGDEVIYTPSPGFQGTDTFTCEICEIGTEKCYTQCTTATVTVTVTCKPPLPLTIAAAGPTNFCPGGSVALTVPPQAGATYRWLKDGSTAGANQPELLATAAGTYALEITTVCGTQRSANAIQVTTPPVPPLPTATGAQRCGPGPVALTARGAAPGNYRWYPAPTGGLPLAGAVNATYVTGELMADVVFYVAATNGNCESARVPVPVTVLPLPAISVSPDTAIRLSEAVTLRAAGGVSYRWEPATGLRNTTSATPLAQPRETTTYTVTITSANGCVARASVTVTVLLELIIPTAISPNGDGVNETWEITNLDRYPEARLEIFDRWGSKIYETTHYRNDWNGTQQGRSLPVGTYFYVITLAPERKLTGPVSIVF